MTPERIAVTFFGDYAAGHKDQKTISIDELSHLIEDTAAPAKSELPWLKLARFGNNKTRKGSLRHDANLIAISGVEADYDAEIIGFDQAVEIAEKAGLAAVLYTSPSHRPEKPRWRILCPLSSELPPDRRGWLIDRINGLYGGIFAGESWTLSQSYYFGSVDHNPAHRVEFVEGQTIDELDELDDIAIGKPNGAAPNGAHPSSATGPLDEDSLANTILTGEAYHVASVRLVGKWAQQKMPLIEAQRRLYDLFDGVFPADRDARWRQRRNDVPRTIADIYGKEAGQRDEKQAQRGGDTASSLILIDPATLHGIPVPPRQWLVPDWIPIARATSLYGAGGEGKTLLAQMLATACAIGKPWLGLPVRQCNSLLLFAEDDLDEMHRRQADINLYYGCTFAEISAMRWLPRLGDDNSLMVFENGRARHTPLFDQLLTAAVDHHAELVITDTLADVFPGNENDRSQARQFAQAALGHIARTTGAASLTLAHPSLTGSANGSTGSGSTGWKGTFRSQLYLETPKADEGDPPDQDIRALRRAKANFARRDETIELRWKAGVFVPLHAATGIIASIERRSAKRVFLDLLAAVVAQGRYVSESPQAAGHYAPQVFGRHPDREGFTRGDFKRAMADLFAEGKIVPGVHMDPARRPHACIVPAQGAHAAQANT